MDNTGLDTQLEQRKSPSFLSKYKFTILSLVIILIALVPLLIISRQHKATVMTHTVAQQPITSPTPIPLTQDNAQPTLSATDTSIQNSLTQSDQDLSTVSQIDGSQDSTAGL